MNVPRFYTERALEEAQSGELAADQARQLHKVLRLGPESRIVLFDGSGAEARASITELRKDRASYRIEEIDYPSREPDLSLSVGLAMVRGNRFDTAVQQLTELGVARIVPLATDRSVVSYSGDRDWSKRVTRLERIAREAAEQSERVTVPIIGAPISLSSFMDSYQALALVERSHAPPLASLSLSQQSALAIGPEGGWSPDELGDIDERASGSAFMGQLILRAETAAIAAAATVMQRYLAEKQ